MPTKVIDVKGLNCPLPIIHLKKAMKDAALGDTVQVLATDPGTVKDFATFCRSTGNELVEQKQDGNVFAFLIKRTT